MENLRIIYKSDLFENEYPYGIRDRSGYLFFFRKVLRFPCQDERYKRELNELNELAIYLLEKLKEIENEPIISVTCKNCKYKKMLVDVYELFRKDYPKQNEKEILEQFGELGEPYSTLNRIYNILNT